MLCIKKEHLLQQQQKKTALHNVNNNHNDVMQTTISMMIEHCFTLRFSELQPGKKEKNK